MSDVPAIQPTPPAVTDRRLRHHRSCMRDKAIRGNDLRHTTNKPSGLAADASRFASPFGEQFLEELCLHDEQIPRFPHKHQVSIGVGSHGLGTTRRSCTMSRGNPASPDRSEDGVSVRASEFNGRTYASRVDSRRALWIHSRDLHTLSMSAKRRHHSSVTLSNHARYPPDWACLGDHVPVIRTKWPIVNRAISRDREILRRKDHSPRRNWCLPASADDAFSSIVIPRGRVSHLLPTELVLPASADDAFSSIIIPRGRMSHF